MRILITTPKEAAGKKHLFFPLFKNETLAPLNSKNLTGLASQELFLCLPEETRSGILKFFRREFKGEEGEVKSLWLANGKTGRAVLFGLGDKQKWNGRKTHLLPRRLVRYAKSERLDNFALLLPPYLDGKIFAAEALMAHFEFNAYKEKPAEGWPEVKIIYLAADKKIFPETEKEIREGMVIGEEVNHCRTLANTPGGDMTPARLAEEAQNAGKKTGLSVKILEEKEIRRLGMGGVLGVARGSTEKPKFIILEYNGSKNPASAKALAGKQKPLVLAGKGVTFDTGGLNLKPDHAIYEMHMDMSGGAAVIHGMAAIARLKIPARVVGLIPAVENMPSGSSYHPGDVLKTMSGKTIEVLNTDAEGRIILADALHYGAAKYKPGLLMDFATLTGAAQSALGRYTSALFTNQKDLTDKLVKIGEESGDYVWPLPLWDEYLENIKGTFGDWANTGKSGSGGGAINGAKFLEQFINGARWAHIDIAPRMTALDNEYLAKGATGVGVRYIVELAKSYPRIV